MPYDKAGSVYAVAMRVTRLNADGTFATGADAMLVTDALVKVDFQLDYDQPDAISRSNGVGRVCLYHQAPATVKGLTVASVEICSEDPELEAMLSGGDVFTDADDNSIGYQAPGVGTEPNANGVAIEAWSSAILDAALAPGLPYMHWAFPRLFLTQQGRTLENDALVPAFEGRGNQNPNFGAGPVGDFTQDTGSVYQWLRVAGVPAPTDGWVAVPPPAGG